MSNSFILTGFMGLSLLLSMNMTNACIKLDNQNATSISYIRPKENSIQDNEYNINMRDNNSRVLEPKNDYKNILNKIDSLIGDSNINYDYENDVFDYFTELRKNEDYYSIIDFLKDNSSKKIRKVLLDCLAYIEFDEIVGIEEVFVIESLKSNHLDLQSNALNALLAWDNISNVNEITNVVIGNRYLNEDLKHFIESVK